MNKTSSKCLGFIIMTVLFFVNCNSKPEVEIHKENNLQSYLSFEYRRDKFTGGIVMIPIITKYGVYRVWTKRIGTNHTKKVLLLHGGPGSTHEIFECFDGYFPQEQIEYIYYDQLESFYSDKPNDKKLWTIPRFVDEIEQVRIALGLNQKNFFLLGHSWGGILALEYALKYQKNLKGLIVCNMMSSIPLYNKYAKSIISKDIKVTLNKYDEKAVDKIDENHYQELVLNKIYTEHILRKPIEDWPDPILRAFSHINDNIYVYLQGNADVGIEGKAKLKNWDIQKFLAEIMVPTLIVGAKYDMMDPEHLKWMSRVVRHGKFLFCPNGSHCPMYDDQEVFFEGIIDFIKNIK
ncbi:MAG: proline iminopeptidase-family hydrolase [Alphaproteobacteria bacterium]|nr:proline iminopeptidase-family hydrolase [Alphaproteobacteria bacterium]